MTKPLSRRTFFRLGAAGVTGLLTAPASALLTLLTAEPAQAYNHVHAHKRINQLALKSFIQRVKNDPWGKHKEFDFYDFSTKGPAVQGFTVKAPGAVEVEQHLVEFSFEEWIMEGGYTADEPEVLSSLRHFYDPLALNRDPSTGRGATYLTDFVDPWIKAAAARYYRLKEAKMDAREWAITGPARSGYDENKYSWKKGLWYMQRAFKEESPEQTKKLFAAAWRALGETMHLMADMTAPAHVRNDAHPGNPLFPEQELTASGMKIDPYEWYIVDNDPKHGDVIGTFSKLPLDPAVASILESTNDIWELFHRIASFTNKNFFSADTVSGKHPDSGKMIKPANGMAVYPSPSLDKCTLDPLGYFEFNGRPVAHMDWADNTWWNATNTVRQQLWNLVGWRKAMSSYQEVCEEQAKTLIPTAVAAGSRLIEWFLPRVEIDIYDFTMVNLEIKGVVVHVPHGPYEDPDLVESVEPMKFVKGPKDWSQLKVNGVPYFETSGAYSLEIEDGRIRCELTKDVPLKGPGQNQFELMLYMGGFWVHSRQVQPQALSMPFMRIDAFAGETFSLSAGASGVQDMPKVPEYVIGFGDGSKALVGSSPRASHVYSKDGQYLATVMLYDKKTGRLVAGAYSMVTVNPGDMPDKEKAAIRLQQQQMGQYNQMPSGPVATPDPATMPQTTVTAEEALEIELQKLRDAGVSEADIAKARKQMELMLKQMNPDAVRP